MQDSASNAQDTKSVGRKFKLKMQDAYQKLLEQNEEAVSVLRNLLETFLKQHLEHRDHHYPREEYVVQQSSLASKWFLLRISTNKLCYIDFRDDLGNMACLHDYLNSFDERATHLCASKLRQLIVICCDVVTMLEESSGVYTSNWPALVQHYTTADQTPRGSVMEELPDISLFRSDGLLGCGGFGSVYKAWFADNVEVTVKFVQSNKFRHSISSAADKICASMIKSPFLVHYYCAFPVTDVNVTVMEYIRGVDLHKIIKEYDNEPPVELCIIVLVQLVMAVHYLHYKGFIHRDVKPSNIMTTPDSKIKLIDFDTVKVCTGRHLGGSSNSYLRKTFVEFQDGQYAGTLSYMAPEIFSKRYYGRAMDWWSVGVSAYQLSLGRLPFRGNDDESLKHRIRYAIISYKGASQAQKQLLQGFLCRVASKRLTSARLDQLYGLEYFKDVDFSLYGTEKQPTYHLEKCERIMQVGNSGVLSPKKNQNTKKEVIGFHRLVPLSHSFDNIHVLNTVDFTNALDKVKRGETVTSVSYEGELELIKDVPEFVDYKFKDYLLVD